MSSGILDILRNPYRIALILGSRNYLNWMPDKLYLSLCYRAIFHKKLNWDSPVTFNEKLQWLKLYDRNPAYTQMVDKIEARKYVQEKIGEEYLIPLLGEWDSYSCIDFNTLPDKFVLKCNHDSGDIVICKDKKSFKPEKYEKKFNKNMKRNFYNVAREWPYKNVRPRILAETFMENSTSEELVDYKLFCFNGKAEYILVCSDRFSDDGLKETFFDIDWKKCDVRRPNHPNSSVEIQKPKNLGLMLELAQKLAGDIPFLRVDFYEINDRVYFGEMTFFPAMGWSSFVPASFDVHLGELINLNSIKEDALRCEKKE